MIFLPRDEQKRIRGKSFCGAKTFASNACEALIADVIAAEGQKLLVWRDVPTNNDVIGESVKVIEPVIKQVFIANACADQDAFERKLFVIRKVIEHKVRKAEILIEWQLVVILWLQSY
jgi:glutamate synthase (NADPH/NADH) large chain